MCPVSGDRCCYDGGRVRHPGGRQLNTDHEARQRGRTYLGKHILVTTVVSHDCTSLVCCAWSRRNPQSKTSNGILGMTTVQSASRSYPNRCLWSNGIVLVM